jgi:tRNA(Arg) A34 adenosine deaminase TadA
MTHHKKEIEMLKPWLERVSQLSLENVENGTGGPFAAIIVKDGKILAEGTNRVLSDKDPTAHAEVVAIRNACKILGNFQLDDCLLISSCEPCPMCLGAIYWARPKAVYFCNDRIEAAQIGFDDELIYKEINLNPPSRKIPFIPIPFAEARKAFLLWQEKEDKTPY